MHVMVAWDVGGGTDVPADVNGEMKRCVEGYSWVRPMRGVLIVRVASEDERDDVVTKLIDAAKRLEKKGLGDMRLIVSSAMPHGWGYAGYLGEKTWEQVEARSE